MVFERFSPPPKLGGVQNFFQNKLSNQFQNIFKKNHLKFYSKKLKIFTKIGGRTTFCVKNKKNQSCSVSAWNGEKMCRKWFLDFLAPPKLGGVQIFLSKMKKFKVAQNCLKWRENWSKKYFWTFQQMFTDVYKFASKCAQICACFYNCQVLKSE